jgi:glutamine synthetase
MCNNNYGSMDLLYTIPSQDFSNEEIKKILEERPEIKFVSMVGIDLRGNDTDEKIPIEKFLNDIDGFLEGGIQTDGSSVVLPGIATLNDGKVDMIADRTVKWFIDYNYEHYDELTDKPVGTLRIPSFLIHNKEKVDSRAILKKASDNFNKNAMKILKGNPEILKSMQIEFDDIKSIELTAATELEFWVKTPDHEAEVEELSIAQVLQEHYWKRTQGLVRTALERSLLVLKDYGFKPEMGHKEVGGITAKVSDGGVLSHVMEQIEIDWEYAEALQAADNELFARALIQDTYRSFGLDVSFLAKPIDGVAGNGEHTHVNAMILLKNGKKKNLFASGRKKDEYMNPIGWGALMGLLKNFEVINPFITATNDGFRRLKPGFEAPVCTVAAIGKNVSVPQRNRTIMTGLIRDTENDLPTRFEVRSPNPHTNTYLALAAIFQGMLDGMKYATESGKTSKELLAEFSKKSGEKADYLETSREYRCEEDVFEHFTENERNKLFGVPPGTVWENLKNIMNNDKKIEVLKNGNVMTESLISSYIQAVTVHWIMELREKILPEYINTVKNIKKKHIPSDFDDI